MFVNVVCMLFSSPSAGSAGVISITGMTIYLVPPTDGT